MSRVDHDIVICGGGVAGACAAALLARQFRVALIEMREPAFSLPDHDIDPRVVAISPGSRHILEAAGGWPEGLADRIGEYRQMQVHSERGSIEFQASHHGLEQLGWIIEIPVLQQTIWRSLESSGRVSLLTPNSIRRFDQDETRVRIELDKGKAVRCRLLVAADGARSRLREQAGMAVDTWHYNQKALVTHIETERPNRGLAWQRFTEHGPLALLPLADGRSSIVWSQPAERAEHLIKMDADDFLDELNASQDSPFGPATACSTRHALPLVRRKARTLVHGRLVLLGDAARTVHPLAGQGLNLGLADAAALAEVLEGRNADDELSPALQRYQRWRLSASTLTGGGIHAINELAFAPGSLGRMLLGVGFGTANRLWPLRERLVRSACGLDSDSPVLARQASEQQQQ